MMEMAGVESSPGPEWLPRVKPAVGGGLVPAFGLWNHERHRTYVYAKLIERKQQGGHRHRFSPKERQPIFIFPLQPKQNKLVDSTSATQTLK